MPRIALICLAMALSGCYESDSTIYTLYRTDVNGDLRLHIATFDSRMKSFDGTGSGEDAYNKENCRLAEDLFKQQPGVKVRFWCEKGRFKP